ncbi:MAG: hypothetical protein ACK4IK_11805 [Bacteroidia bacterium]
MRITILIICIILTKSAISQQLKKYSPLYVKDTLVINTGQTSPLKLWIHELIIVDNKNYLKITDKKNKNLLLYDLSKKRFDTIYIKNLWNNAAWHNLIGHIFVFNFNRIFISGGHNELLMINKDGNILDKWTYNKKDKYGDYYHLKFHRKNLIFINDSVFYGIHSLFINSDNPDNRRRIFNQNNIVKAKLINDKIVCIKEFGNFYKNAEELYCTHLSYKPSFVLNPIDSLVILYFYKHDSIQIYKNEQLIKNADVSSIYKTSYKTYNQDLEKNEPGYFERYMVEEPGNIDVQYDKFRKLYYILYRHRQNYKEIDGKINNENDADFSIIILNRNFKKINEIVLKNEYKYTHKLFVLKEGVAIDYNHEFQPHLKENKLKFLILDIDKYVK